MNVVIKFFTTILRARCLKQNSCHNCLFHDYCGKLPSEW